MAKSVFGMQFSIPLSSSIEDAESHDIEKMYKSFDAEMDKLYPSFEPEIFTSMTGKEYYLPALKVLEKDYLGDYYSPSRHNRWDRMELVAVCNKSTDLFYSYFREKIPEKHDAPHEDCDCGIYGSVNLEEVESYLSPNDGILRAFTIPSHSCLHQNSYFTQKIDAEYKYKKSERVLCIIEPSPGAEVILCRKGWKASKAFISEILPDTMSIDDASSLLSMVWHRDLDIRRIYDENR